MYSKCLVLSAFAVALAVVCALAPTGVNAVDAKAPNKSHHLIVGSRLPGDRLVLSENIIKNSKWLQVVTAEKTFRAPRYQIITQVSALDQKTNGKGAFASLIKGGPGHNNVTLKFKSQRGHGINFRVQIYARFWAALKNRQFAIYWCQVYPTDFAFMSKLLYKLAHFCWIKNLYYNLYIFSQFIIPSLKKSSLIIFFCFAFVNSNCLSIINCFKKNISSGKNFLFFKIRSSISTIIILEFGINNNECLIPNRTFVCDFTFSMEIYCIFNLYFQSTWKSCCFFFKTYICWFAFWKKIADNDP